MTPGRVTDAGGFQVRHGLTTEHSMTGAHLMEISITQLCKVILRLQFPWVVTSTTSGKVKKQQQQHL